MNRKNDAFIYKVSADGLQKRIEEYLPIRVAEKDKLGEVFTPIGLIDDMLDTLPPTIWQNPQMKWLDPANGVGNFTTAIYSRLFIGLKSWEPEEEKRRRHIVKNMLFMIELNPGNVKISREIFGADANICCADFIRGEKKWKKDFGVVDTTEFPFDIIIGNPPYNEERKITSDTALYHKFVKSAIQLSKRWILFVIPSRWFIGGKGLNEFREFMLKRRDIVYIHHIPDSRTIWSQIDIKGGINYFLIDKTYDGFTSFNGTKIQLDKYDVLLPNKEADSMIRKILPFPQIDQLYLSTGYFGITTNSSHFHGHKGVGAKMVRCYVSNQKGHVKYVDPKYISSDYHFWKVFTPQGSGKGGDGFGQFIVGSPNEIASQTYFTFKVNSKEEAESLVSYLKTKFANFMLSLRKIDQHISKNTLLWVPLPPLTHMWTDTKIYNYYHLSSREIKIIENHSEAIQPRKTRKREIHNRKTMKRMRAII